MSYKTDTALTQVIRPSIHPSTAKSRVSFHLVKPMCIKMARRVRYPQGRTGEAAWHKTCDRADLLCLKVHSIQDPLLLPKICLIRSDERMFGQLSFLALAGSLT